MFCQQTAVTRARRNATDERGDRLRDSCMGSDRRTSRRPQSAARRKRPSEAKTGAGRRDETASRELPGSADPGSRRENLSGGASLVGRPVHRRPHELAFRT